MTFFSAADKQSCDKSDLVLQWTECILSDASWNLQQGGELGPLGCPTKMRIISSSDEKTQLY